MIVKLSTGERNFIIVVLEPLHYKETFKYFHIRYLLDYIQVLLLDILKSYYLLFLFIKVLQFSMCGSHVPYKNLSCHVSKILLFIF